MYYYPISKDYAINASNICTSLNVSYTWKKKNHQHNKIKQK